MTRKHNYLSYLLGAGLLSGLYLTSLHSYVLFHTLAEMFSIVVAFAIFLLAWHTRRFLDNSYLLVVGIAYLFVGFLDLLHTIGFKGMGVFQGYGTNLATQLWVSSRYLESVSFLIAPAILRRKLNLSAVVAVYVSAVSLLLGFIFYWKIFPTCFVEGEGLTAFKKISEYVIAAILLGSIAGLAAKRGEFDPGVFRLLVASIVVTIGSEIAFTLYSDPYGLPNMAGHYLKIVSFFLIYRAVVVTGLERPYAIVFRKLKRSEESLQRSRDELELRVKERTDELRKLVAELAHVTRLTTLGEFTASLAHELNQPLTAIVSNAHASLRLLLRDNPDLDEVREALQDVAEDGVRAGEVIRRLRTLAKRGVSGKTRFDLNRAIREIVALARSEAAAKETSIRLALDSGLPQVLGDRVQVQQVVMNLLLNGIEAMVDVEAESRELVVTTKGTESGEIEVTVSDAGSGIEAEKIEQIFEPFVTTKSEGMGMGLSINRSILAAHGGRLWATNNAERGATFHFTLPAIQERWK